MKNKFLEYFTLDKRLKNYLVWVSLVLIVVFVLQGITRRQSVIFAELNAKKNLALRLHEFKEKMKALEASLGLILEGVILNQDNPLAVIQGNILKIGDQIGRYKLIAIENDQVLLNDGNKNIELKVKE
jgi:hypothetical protein